MFAGTSLEIEEHETVESVGRRYSSSRTAICGSRLEANGAFDINK
jgi:hypothetical protein